MKLSRLSFAGMLPVLLAVGCGSVSPAADASGMAGSSAGGSSAGSAGHGGAGSTGAGGNTGAGGSGVCTCTLEYNPVCGVDGMTYGNTCDAGCAGVIVAHQGPCVDGGSDGPTSSDAGTDASKGSCVTDNDCIFRAAAGCCGACLAKTDPIPPTLACGIACRIGPPSCVCENHRCAIGTLPTGSTCDPNHNLCGYSLCCPQCGGFPGDGGMSCSAPICTQPSSPSGTLVCPPAA